MMHALGSLFPLDEKGQQAPMFRMTLSSLILSGFLMGGLTVLSGCSGSDQKSPTQVEVTEAQKAETQSQQSATEAFYKEQMKKKR